MRVQALTLVILSAFLLATTGCEGDKGPIGPVGPPGPSTILGFANVNADPTTPTVRTFGGGVTTNVQVSRIDVGNYEVTFTGTYTGVASTSDVTVLATINDTSAFNVASASMDQGSANATTIVVRVFVWSTNTTPNPLADEDFSVLVMQ